MAERGKRTVRDLRRGNRASLLRHLYFEGPLSRQELGRATGLSAGSISNVVGELIADGMVEEAGAVESDGGRPRILLQVAAGYGYVVGVDVGETRVRVELFDLALTERASADLPLSDSGHDVDHVVGSSLDGIESVVREAGIDDSEVLGVGIGVPGIVDQGDPAPCPARATASSCTARPSAGTPCRWAGCCGPAPRLPLFIDNGAKTLGQAEMWFGGGRGSEQRRDRADRLRRRRLRRRRRQAVPRREQQRRRVGPHHAAGRRPHLPLRLARLPGGVRRRRGAARPLAAAPPEGVSEETGARRAARRRRPRPGGGRAARRGRRVPGRGHRRPDQPLQPAADRDRRLGRTAARPAPAAHRPRGRRRLRPAPPRARRPPSSWAGSAPTRSPSARPPCRWPASSTPAASARSGSRPRTTPSAPRRAPDPVRNRIARAVR